MTHIVLLGDSIFDNARYVGDAPDIIRQLRASLPAGSRATLLAIDGSVTTDVSSQLSKLPSDATHLVVSCGGNDAIMRSDILDRPARSTAETLALLADAGEEFERNYREMLAGVISHNLPSAVCTVYYPNFSDAPLQRIAKAALTIFNDCIIRLAVAEGIPLIDLRLVCSDTEDYANEIEPSARGGEKIARVIARLIVEHDFARGRTTFFC